MYTTSRMTTPGYVLPAHRKKAAEAKAALGPCLEDLANHTMFPSLAPSATSMLIKPKMNFGNIVKERIRLDEEEATRIAGWDAMNPSNMTAAELEETGWAKLRLLSPTASPAEHIAWHSAIVKRMVARQELETGSHDPWASFAAY